MGSKISVRTGKELFSIKKSGTVAAQALRKVILAAKPGISLLELDKIAEEAILKLGAKPAFKTVPDYCWTTCLTVNEEVVHGIPDKRILQEGDILGIDLGAIYNGWYSDVAWSILVGNVKNKAQNTGEKERFLQVGELALKKAISQAKQGNKIGDISSTIQKIIEGSGYAIVRSLSGHGIGKSYHEEPEIPGFGKAGVGQELKEGMVLAIEVIYAAREGELYQQEDGWTLQTKDGSLGGLFEMTVIIGKKNAEIVTDWRLTSSIVN